MKRCTFFGHRSVTEEIEPKLRESLIDLIENRGVQSFYVGNQGGFDHMVIRNLKRLKKEYSHIDYAVVLAYLPTQKENFETLYPEGLEKTPLKFAIDKRNRWMIEKSDYVVTYVTGSVGGAAKFKILAEKRKKVVINLK